MSLAQWTEPKPCALSQPRFVKIRVRDERGVPTGETYTKRVSKPTCESGEAAVTSVTVNGQVHHLCPECTKADLLDVLGETPVVATVADYAAPAYVREGDKIVVRQTPDTLKLRQALAAGGFRAQTRNRTVKRAGCATVQVSVWTRA
jgi:hypothetical protein